MKKFEAPIMKLSRFQRENILTASATADQKAVSALEKKGVDTEKNIVRAIW